jgi:hypothetical protein
MLWHKGKVYNGGVCVVGNVHPCNWGSATLNYVHACMAVENVVKLAKTNMEMVVFEYTGADQWFTVCICGTSLFAPLSLFRYPV